MKQIAIRYGLWMFFSLTGFFLLMHILHLSEYYYLRVFNGVIHLGFLWMAISAWNHAQEETTSDYMEDVVLGMFTSFIGVIPFTIFMSIFLAVNPDLLAVIKSQAPVGEYITPMTSCFFIVVEAIVISLFGSYLIARIQGAWRNPV